ncbi:proteasome assembly chaperone family protein [Candidatus Woesearchaeota archaeon]|nr:proteasome assembly chaperone family protein [Candidatus Woesearchaeota archaeon]
MKIILKKIPKNPIIIEGFPSFGLVGTITTEFLLEHLKAELIGEFQYTELGPISAIHKGKLVNPMAVWHVPSKNIVILHTILNVKGYEWELADEIIKMAQKMQAKEILGIEGVATDDPTGEVKVYYYGDKKLEATGALPVKESIIMGVSGALMQRYKKINCIFGAAHSQLPDSKAAAKIIEVLDKYLGLKVDYNPLLKQAEAFEDKLKTIIQQSSKTVKEADKKAMSYLG